MTGLVTRRTLIFGGATAAAMLVGRSIPIAAQPTGARQFGARGDGRADDTAALQAALDASLDVRLDPGTYLISAPLRLRSGLRLRLSPGAVVRQTRLGRNALVAERCSDVTVLLDGGTILGPGGYNRPTPWTGNQGPEGHRGVRFLGCTNARIAGPGRVINWGNAGIDFTGGSGLSCEQVTIEGTHAHGGPIARFGNFQNGIYIANHRQFGAANAVSISSCDLSGMAQGILREALPGAPAPSAPTTIRGCLFHDIPGQHGIYNQDGLLDVVDCRFRDLAGSAVKTQAADAGRVLRGIRASGIEAERIGGSLFETAEVGGFGGGVADVSLSGRGTGVGFLASLNGRVVDAEIDVSGRDVANNAVFVQGAGCRNVRIRVDAEAIAQDGVMVVARNASLEVRAAIRDPNGGGSLGGSAVRVSSPSADVTVIDLAASDRRGRMVYGLFSEIAGSTVRVRGTLRVAGANDVAVRANGRIVDLPANAVLQGRHGAFVGRENIVIR